MGIFEIILKIKFYKSKSSGCLLPKSSISLKILQKMAFRIQRSIEKKFITGAHIFCLLYWLPHHMLLYTYDLMITREFCHGEIIAFVWSYMAKTGQNSHILSLPYRNGPSFWLKWYTFFHFTAWRTCFYYIKWIRCYIQNKIDIKYGNPFKKMGFQSYEISAKMFDIRGVMCCIMHVVFGDPYFLRIGNHTLPTIQMNYTNKPRKTMN